MEVGERGEGGGGRGRRLDIALQPACPSSLLTRKRDFLPSREALKLENPYIGRAWAIIANAGGLDEPVQ